jgi:hypothetical protein
MVGAGADGPRDNVYLIIRCRRGQVLQGLVAARAPGVVELFNLLAAEGARLFSYCQPVRAFARCGILLASVSGESLVSLYRSRSPSVG